jgi:hypothetical protein
MNGFQKSIVVINILGVVVSVSMFVATWFNQGFVIRQARQIALESARSYMKPVVEFLENPKVVSKLPAPVEEKLRNEIEEYRKSPDKWLLGIFEGTKDRAADFEFPEIRNPIARKALGFLTGKLGRAKEHFQKSFANLILDLRIFSGTNACAFLIGAWLCMVAKTRQARHWLGAWSAILIFSTILVSYAYLNQSWGWSILFNRYWGWSYPAFNIGFTAYLFLRLMPEIWSNAPASLTKSQES